MQAQEREERHPALAWVKQLLVVLAGGLAIVALDLTAPSLIARQAVRTIALDQARALQAQILEGIGGPAGAPLAERIAEADRAYLATVARAAGVGRLAILSADGRALWGFGADGSGQPIRPWEARDILLSATKSQSESVEISEAEGGPGEGIGRTVRAVVPMFRDGRVAAVIFTERDVTELWNGFSGSVRDALIAVSIGGFLLIGVLSVLTLREGRRRIADLRERAAHERHMLEEQMRLAREVRLLGELNEWLQSCRSLEELYGMVAEFMGHLLPGSEGSLYIYSNSRDALDGCTSWNGGAHKDHIHPEECWGLRRGRAYAFGQGAVEFPCGHASPHDGRPYVCFPILAHGETIGLLHLRSVPGQDRDAFFSTRKLAQMSAEQISLAIANVRMRDQLQDQSVRDPLTGLYNRRHLTDALRRMVARVQSSGRPLSLLSIDVDHFKKFNDTHGHDAGDMVLRAVGSLLERQCDGDQIACRLGGEEFMILLPDLTVDRTLQAAESLRLAVEAVTIRYGEKTLPRISVSIGIAMAPVHGTVPQELMRVADDALYAAKAAGRNQVVLALLPGEADLGGAAASPAASAAASPGALPPTIRAAE